MEIIQDDLNVIEITDLQIAMQAIENKIIVKVDQYKSGYECKTCKGSGRVKSTVNEEILRSCDDCNGKGETLIIPDSAKSLPSTGVIMSMGPKTESMLIKAKIKDIKANMKLHTNTEAYDWDLESCNEAEEELKNCLLHVGTRIVFGTHTGTKIPLRGEIKLTIMTEKEPLCVLFGTNIEDRAILDYTAENI